MNDKDIMEGILLTTKGVCDLYMHGSIESATPNVHQTFNAALNDALCMQNNIYNEMAQHGWYPSEQAQPQQIQQSQAQLFVQEEEIDQNDDQLDDAADGGGLSAADVGHEIKLEQSDQQPVHAAENGENQ